MVRSPTEIDWNLLNTQMRTVRSRYARDLRRRQGQSLRGVLAVLDHLRPRRKRRFFRIDPETIEAIMRDQAG